jgi:hypothetical protein
MIQTVPTGEPCSESSVREKGDNVASTQQAYVEPLPPPDHAAISPQRFVLNLTVATVRAANPGFQPVRSISHQDRSSDEDYRVTDRRKLRLRRGLERHRFVTAGEVDRLALSQAK